MTPEQFVAIIGSLTALIVAVGAAIVQIVQLRAKVDGRLSELLAITRAGARTEGELVGRDYVAPLPAQPPVLLPPKK